MNIVYLPKKINVYHFRSIYSFKQFNYYMELEEASTNAIFFLDTKCSAGKLINIKIQVEPETFLPEYSFILNIEETDTITFNTLYYYNFEENVDGPVLFDTDINGYFYNINYKRTIPNVVEYLKQGYETLPKTKKEERMYEGLYLIINTNSQYEFKKVNFSIMIEDLDATKIK